MAISIPWHPMESSYIGPCLISEGSHMAQPHFAGPPRGWPCPPLQNLNSLSTPLPSLHLIPISVRASSTKVSGSFQSTTATAAAMEPCVEDLIGGDRDDLSFTSTASNATTITSTTTTNNTSLQIARTSVSSESESSSTSAISSLPSSTSSKLYHAPPCDACWNAMRGAAAECRDKTLTLADLHFVNRLGSGDLGSVFLVEIKGGDGCLFAAKVMDNKEMAARSKVNRARIEREILEIMEHPFLPTLYAALDSPKWSCLLTEFCPGGDLHVLRQRQPDSRFHEAAVRFYAAEIVAALEYLHMMGIIYRDLKPENVLVRSDGHIMLTDFDLSLKDDNSISTAQIVSGEYQRPDSPPSTSAAAADATRVISSSCILPNCIAPAVSCFHPMRRRRKKSTHQRGALEIVAEPMDVRSMSFVGTYEYLAPEIVSGEGHGSAVDWWTLGIFMYELLYGTTPFKGMNHELTMASIVARALEFPKDPSVPGSAKDLITQLLIKDPATRLGSTMGAAAIKRHPFFDGVNWALLRCRTPPYVPRPLTSNKNCQNDVAPDHDTSVQFY